MGFPVPVVLAAAAPAAGGTAITLSVGTAMAAGITSAIAVVMSCNGTPGDLPAASNPVVDTQGNQYTLLTSAPFTGSSRGQWTYIAYNAIPLGLTDTVTCTWAGSTVAHTAVAAALPGVAAAAAADQILTAAHGNTTDPMTVSPGHLGWGTELVIAVEVNGSGGGTPSWASGWTPLETITHGAGLHVTSIAYQVTTTTKSNLAAAATLPGGTAIWSMTGAALLPAVYEAGSASVTSGTTVTVPVTTATGAGDTLVAGASSSGHGVISNVTDTQGNQYALGPVNVNPGGSGGGLNAASSAIAVDAVPLGLTDSIIVTMSGTAGSKTVIVAGLPGADPVSPVDQASGTGGTSASPAVESGTLAQSPEITIAVETNANAGAGIGWAAGWVPLTAPIANPASGGQYTAMASQNVTGETPVTASGTITSATWSLLLLTFLATVPASGTGTIGKPVRAVQEPPTAHGRVIRKVGPWFGSGTPVRTRRGPVADAHRRLPEDLYGRVRRGPGAPAMTLPPGTGPPIRQRTGPVPNWGRRPAGDLYGRVRRGPGAPYAAAPPVNVTQVWTRSRQVINGFAPDAPMTGSLDVPVSSDGTRWLIAYVSQTLPPGFLGSTLGVADDVHGCWFPLGVPDGTSSADGYTRCSIWARPSPGAVNPPGDGEPTRHVYVYPTGSPPIYPTVIGCTVIEVSGMSPYIGLPTVVTASANQAGSLSLDAGTPTSQALALAVAASDGAQFNSGPGPGWQSLPGIAVTDAAPITLCTAPAWMTGTLDAAAAWTTGLTEEPVISDLSACVAVILTDVPAPVQPNPNWPYAQLLFGFGSGASTPLDEITWTDLTSRLEGAQETSATRGKQYQLDQTQAGQVQLTLSNEDSYLSPDNTASPYYPDMVADTPVMLQMTWAGRCYRMFTSYVSRIPQNWSTDTRRGLAQITCADSWSLLNSELDSCQQEEILGSQPGWYWPDGDAAGAGYAQNAAPGNTTALQMAESKAGSGGAAAVFGADSGVNPGDPDATVWSQTGLGMNDTGNGFVLACQDSFPALSDGVAIMGWFNPVAPTAVAAAISKTSTSFTCSTQTSFTGGQPVVLAALGGTVPGGFTDGGTYYVVSSSGTTVTLASTPGGPAVTATSAGSCSILTGQPPGENLYLLKGSNSATGDVFALMLGWKPGYEAGQLFMRVYDRVTRQPTDTLVNGSYWLGAGNTHYTLLISQQLWQVVINGGADTGGFGSCNLPDTFQWVSLAGSADRFYTGSIFNTEVSHVAIFPRQLTAGRLAQIVIAGSPVADGGQFPELPDLRIERLLGYGGWLGPRAISTASTTVMAPISDIQGSPGYVSVSGQVTNSGGQQTSQAVSNIVVSDNGMAYVDGNGVLCYITRNDLYGLQPMWFLGEDTSSGEYPVQGDLTFGYDKAHLANVAELTPSIGSGTPVIATSADSVEQHSETDYSATVYQNDINDTIDQATWIVNAKGEPANRLEKATVNAAANASNWPFVLGAEPGQAIQGTRRPVTASQPTQVQALIVQVKKTLNFKAGTASCEVVTDSFPEGSVLIADDPTYGQLNGQNLLPW